MSDDDDDLEDPVLAAEIELLASVMVAASNTTEHLTQEQVDALLGVQPKG